jgi:hypothetical protein
VAKQSSVNILHFSSGMVVAQFKGDLQDAKSSSVGNTADRTACFRPFLKADDCHNHAMTHRSV